MHGPAAMSRHGCGRTPRQKCAALPTAARHDAGGACPFGGYETYLCQRFGARNAQSQRSGLGQVGRGVESRSARAIAALQSSVKHMKASRYDPLTPYLKASEYPEFEMTFAEIEMVIGSPLPPYASSKRFWQNTITNPEPQRKAIAAAGFETFFIPGARRVRFKRVR